MKICLVLIVNVELFRKIKGLRNDISHGRIDGLKYEGLRFENEERKDEKIT